MFQNGSNKIQNGHEAGSVLSPRLFTAVEEVISREYVERTFSTDDLVAVDDSEADI